MVNSCSVVGCTTNKRKCPTLTYFSVLRKDKEWQEKLVRAINRLDKDFNVTNALICSRHFEESCFNTIAGYARSKIKLKDGSLPTKYLPQLYYVSTKPPPTITYAALTLPVSTEINCPALENVKTAETFPTASDVVESLSSKLEKGWHIIPVGEFDYDILEYKDIKVLKCMKLRTVDEGIKCISFVAGIQIGENFVQDCEQAQVGLTQLQGAELCNSGKCTGVEPLCSNCKHNERNRTRRLKRQERTEQKQIKLKTLISKVNKSKMSAALKLQRKSVKNLQRVRETNTTSTKNSTELPEPLPFLGLL